MTDEQIVKALKTLDDAVALIKRQQAEIESLEADYENVYKQATADILASIADGGTSCEWCIDKHRTEAVREFAEKLKDEVRSDLFNDFVDNLVKETTEKEGGAE